MDEEENFNNYLEGKSVLELIDDLTFLDNIKPYAELSPNGEIGQFFSKRQVDIPINTAEEFKVFYNKLNDKIAELGDTEKGVETFLQNRNYLNRVGNLAIQMSKLENMMNENFGELVPAFKSVFNYAWDAVMNKHFKMDEEGETALEKYSGRIIVEKNRVIENASGEESVKISMLFEESDWCCHIYKTKLEKRIVPTKIFGFVKNKVLFRKRNPEEGEFFVCRVLDACCSKFYSSTSEYVDKLQNTLMNASNSDALTNEFGAYIKNMVNLPVIMSNYITTKQEQLKKIFSS